ncbi:hypothetical protein NDU88_004412 [Pleurodeles waltl]|uniref:MHC class I antigen n=1 Tax=Pleurodeles waltl TaxID=8319 RepID=A0AAV7PDX5_PLEWA|nr:hypothetical protein NDU88_004412 [Pleurodeles waltl]
MIARVLGGLGGPAMGLTGDITTSVCSVGLFVLEDGERRGERRWDQDRAQRAFSERYTSEAFVCSTYSAD